MKKLNPKKSHEYALLEKSDHGQVPGDFLPIYVGEERKRYVVPLGYLSSTLFQALLYQFEDEIVADSKGPIALPCSTQMFECVLDQCERSSFVMSEAIKGSVASAEQKEVGPNYFRYYVREIVELLSQDEDFLPPFSSLTSQLPASTCVRVKVHDVADLSKKVKEDNGFTSSSSLFSNGIGAGLSDFKRERLKASLRQSVIVLTQEVDEMLDPVVSMRRIQSCLRNKERISSYSSASEVDVRQPPCKKQKISSSSSPTSISDGEPVSSASSTEESGSEDMDTEFLDADTLEERKSNEVKKRFADCKTTRTRGRGGPTRPKVNDDLQFLLENGGSQVEETLKKYSDELSATLGHMEQQLEELLDIVMSKCRPMTLVEKQELRKLIQKLPQKNLDRVVEIIQHSRLPETCPCDEIHIDLEKEDSLTLWRLYYYVEAVKNAKKLSS
ncbi:hypothetical protein HHK36_015684 [Tetracentron sinense]|uniref:NET domain-containing protein n=1 Tax=Tetracentron sinense TaxID=13715 RepID=A0A835DD22_TETSI|nr:hypothetical protein HHK36_015684 [Tetracentron sinense]